MTRRSTALLPRLSRAGFKPVGPGRRVRSGMMLPKPDDRRYYQSATVEVPAMLLGQLGPAERVALREIAETGDILQRDGKTYIVAAISAMTLDTLSAFEVDLDDHELLLDHDEGVIQEDREPDDPGGDGTRYQDCDIEAVNEDGLEPGALS